MKTKRENAQQCDLCGRIRELRPYGQNGECVCFDCGMRDEAAAKREFMRRFEEETHDTEAHDERL